jgi:hypothetical protein
VIAVGARHDAMLKKVVVPSSVVGMAMKRFASGGRQVIAMKTNTTETPFSGLAKNDQRPQVVLVSFACLKMIALTSLLLISALCQMMRLDVGEVNHHLHAGDAWHLVPRQVHAGDEVGQCRNTAADGLRKSRS